ncbi:Isoquinoline 1-oxidoreductase subunit beta [Gammaproteobacteria bacterium MOLA455]|nr:Isoquinoline 1-oxidoreductase subunit beta [Gammaproteobacteria bacterium MOLA455]
MKKASMTRRLFLLSTGAAATGLIVGCSTAAAKGGGYSSIAGAFEPNSFIQITPDNQVIFYLPSSEMGQGILDGLTTLIAEELRVQPGAIDVRHASLHEDYKNPEMGMQATGGSNATRAQFLPLRQAAADTAAAIRNAAAKQLDQPLDKIALADGQVIVEDKSYGFGDFVAVAALMPVPENSPLRSPKQFDQIGRERPRLDALSKSTGSAEFGIDAEVENLYRAVVVRSPVLGATLLGFDASAALKRSGVVDVVQIKSGVAVVAQSYWQARQAAAALELNWEKTELASWSSDSIYNKFNETLNDSSQKGLECCDEGEGDKLLDQSATVVAADYYAPYLAHATMEPLNCTVEINGDACAIYLGTQNIQASAGAAVYYGDFDADKVKVHPAFLGGGFGRRGLGDDVAEAVLIAQQTGRNIQLVWSREDDMSNDFYRPAALVRMQAGVSEQGLIETWAVRRVGPNIMGYMLDEWVDALAPDYLNKRFVDWLSKLGRPIFNRFIADPSAGDGIYSDYDTPNKAVRHVTQDPGLRTGFWRSVGHSSNAFFKESFIDELAQSAGIDELQFRLANMKNNPRLTEATQLVAAKAGWGKPLPEGHFHGLATHSSFGSAVAEIAEVSIEGTQIIVHKVTAAIHCGMVVNPGIVRDQIEGGIVYGLTAALHGEITLVDGVIQQSNFHDYPILRMADAPEVEVHIVASQEHPEGVGEPGLPPLAPAVANAVFKASGQRLRDLPLRLS